MINQLNRRNGQPTPYFFRGPTGMNPYGVNLYSAAHLTLDYHYLCSLHCRGVQMAPVRHSFSPCIYMFVKPAFKTRDTLRLTSIILRPSQLSSPRASYLHTERLMQEMS